MLTDAAAEYHGVGMTAHYRKIGAEIFPCPVAKCFNRQTRAPMALPFRPQERLHIGRKTGKSEEARLLIEHPFNIRAREGHRVCKEPHKGRIEVAASGAHDQTFKRSKSHRRVDGSPAADCGGRTPVPKMQRDEVDFAEWLAA